MLYFGEIARHINLLPILFLLNKNSYFVAFLHLDWWPSIFPGPFVHISDSDFCFIRWTWHSKVWQHGTSKKFGVHELFITSSQHQVSSYCSLQTSKAQNIWYLSKGKNELLSVNFLLTDDMYDWRSRWSDACLVEACRYCLDNLSIRSPHSHKPNTRLYQIISQISCYWPRHWDIISICTPR